MKNHVLSLWHHLRGSWYCQYCDKMHPRRRVQYALQIDSKKVTIIPVHASIKEHQLVCHKGRDALRADTLNTVMSETWEPKIFFECNPMLNTECTKTNCWINNILNPQGCCSRTTDYKYSDTGLVLWPDTSLGQLTGLLSSPTCRHCPLEPSKCRDFQAAHGVRPCNIFSTYSAFMLRK